MDFSWTKEQVELKNKAIHFAQEKLNNNIIEQDRLGEFPRQKWIDCAAFGVQGLIIPEHYGGLGLDILSAVLVMEGLGYGCKDNGILFSINAHVWSCEVPILHFGTDEQRTKYLPGLCNGSLIGAHGMTEPESGSDAFSMRTTAKKAEGCYVLNGTKTLITNAAVADIVIAFAKTQQAHGKNKISCFILERGTAGFLTSKKIDKMGLRTSPFGEIVLQDCIVPLKNIIGNEGSGQTIFNNSMAEERAFILATQIGAMERQLEECLAYAKARKQFQKRIFDFQAVSGMLAEMKVRLETSRLMVYNVAWLRQQKKRAFLESSIAKLYVSECCIKNALSAVRIHGGYGYTTEYEMERQLRDSIGGVLYSGTSEIQHNIISQLLD